ncbi:MAG TPA: hypothetical protein VK755_04305 [Candidatus Acidoferrales bacterium]|jgi:hypothetical protein|nr:hypothetical protein [Candidatus Acidoferrales bacterium]
MRFNLKRSGLTAAAAALSASMVACHGQSPGSTYMPTGPTALSIPQTGAALPAPNKKQKKVEIVSSCGQHVHIVIAGIVDCKFREQGYGDGTFTLTNDTKGIVIITPMSGTRATTFTILGALIGSGYFEVKDTRGHVLKVTVKVTL